MLLTSPNLPFTLVHINSLPFPTKLVHARVNKHVSFSLVDNICSCEFGLEKIEYRFQTDIGLEDLRIEKTGHDCGGLNYLTVLSYLSEEGQSRSALPDSIFDVDFETLGCPYTLRRTSRRVPACRVSRFYLFYVVDTTKRVLSCKQTVIHV